MELTPKEKTKELVMKFQYIVTSWDCYNDEPLELEYMMSDMKKCALICLDEMENILMNGEDLIFENASKVMYLEEVKEEVNKL